VGRFSVPEVHQSGLGALANLSEDDFASLRNALTSIQSAVSRENLLGHVKKAISGLSPAQAEHLTSALITAEASRIRYGFSIKEMAATVASSVEADDQDALNERLVSLLEAGPLRQIGKAVDLQLEHQQILQNARILTDVRPIFQDDPDSAPEGAVVIHTLRIAYHDASGESRSIFFGMDSEDIKSLRDSADRATRKSEALQATLSQLPLALMDMTDQGEE
jgi:hypothetical protein